MLWCSKYSWLKTNNTVCVCVPFVIFSFFFHSKLLLSSFSFGFIKCLYNKLFIILCINLLKSALYIYIPLLIIIWLTCCPKKKRRKEFFFSKKNEKKFLSYSLRTRAFILNSVSILFTFILLLFFYCWCCTLMLCWSNQHTLERAHSFAVS